MEVYYMKIQYFNGIRFTQSNDGEYFNNSTIHKSMHRYVWEYYNGSIPKGYEVHHKDFDKSNNDISNLQLLKESEHKKLHGELLTKEQREWRRNNLNENARPKAIEWHKSKIGKAWHKEQVNIRKDNRSEVHGICLQCKKEFIGYNNQGHTKKFCSGACAQKYRRNNGLNDIIKICPICNKEYKTDKYRPSQTCSKSCANKLKWNNGVMKRGN